MRADPPEPARGRPLTAGECTLLASVFGRAIDPDRVRIHRRKWFWFQPNDVVMAPDGHLWVPPRSGLWSDDYSRATLALQGLFIHEMTHVWQAQRGGRWFLPLMRHPFCRYHYDFRSDRPFRRYGLEQQAELVRHAFLRRQGMTLPEGKPDLAAYRALLPFDWA